jgi:hypothetical protein
MYIVTIELYTMRKKHYIFMDAMPKGLGEVKSPMRSITVM